MPARATSAPSTSRSSRSQASPCCLCGSPWHARRRLPSASVTAGRRFTARPASAGTGGFSSLLKFRTMAVDAEMRTGPVWAVPGDARVTAVGRLLRRFHVDELPQVVNVLRGEMSLVGPRPERPELAARIERDLPGFPRRLAVPPGIAGLAQACCPAPVTPARKLRYDRVYIAAMTPWLDLKLCALCALRVLRGRSWRARRRPGAKGGAPGCAPPHPAGRARSPGGAL